MTAALLDSGAWFDLVVALPVTVLALTYIARSYRRSQP